MKLKLVLVIFTCIHVTIIGQPKFVEKISRKGSEVIIPYEKYKLPNGLTILLHEDHSDPVVYVDVTYHVGSAREQEGRSGFAHFFEHMMFQGSEHVGDEQHFKIVTESGGTLNGTTNADRTNYYELLPANQLEIALWLESDRMGFLLDSVTQKKFEVQRATVKNERGQNYDNRPYGLVGEKIGEALYPTNHPYAWTTIGYIEDLNRVTVEDLKNFFMRWYGPNNATLTIAGDINVTTALKMVQKYFGNIPMGKEVIPNKVSAVVLENDRFISYQDNIRLPQLQIVYPTVPAGDKDEAALDVLADILSGGKTSPFYQNFIKSEKAQFATTYQSARELAGNFTVSVRCFPEFTLPQMDSLVKISFAEFEKNGVTEDDLLKFKNSFEASMINSLESVQGKGAMLASYQTYYNDPAYLKVEIANYLNVTKEDVLRVYNTYIKDKNKIVLSVYPKGKPELKLAPDSYKNSARNIQNEESSEYKNLTYTKPKDTFNRDKKPIAGENSVIESPLFWKDKFSNGLQIIGTTNTETPSISLQLSVEAGHRSETIEKAGISSILADLLGESTKKYTAEQIGEKLERLGSSINIYNSAQDITIDVSSLSKNIDSTLLILEEILFSPKFDLVEFERIKKQTIEAIENQNIQATVIASKVYNKLLYGSNHIMGISAIGTVNTVTSVTLDEVKKYYYDYFSPALAKLVIVGEFDKEIILARLEFLKKWNTKNAEIIVQPASPEIDKTKIYFVNKENAPQSEIRIGHLSMPFDAEGEFYKSTIMNYILGGAFNSRINLNLRESKGYTYGARSSFSGSKYVGPFTASAGVKANTTDSSIVEFIKEIKNYSENGIDSNELLFTKNSIGQSEALKYETPFQKATFLRRILDYKLEPDFTKEQNKILQGIEAIEINQLAKKNLRFNNMIILVVGDKETCLEPMNKLGYQVIQLSMDGEPIVE
jgi:zinc protease